MKVILRARASKGAWGGCGEQTKNLPKHPENLPKRLREKMIFRNASPLIVAFLPIEIFNLPPKIKSFDVLIKDKKKTQSIEITNVQMMIHKITPSVDYD